MADLSPLQALDHADRLLSTLSQSSVAPFNLSQQAADQLTRARVRIVRDLRDALPNDALVLHVLASATKDVHASVLMHGLVDGQAQVEDEPDEEERIAALIARDDKEAARAAEATEPDEEE